MLIKSIEVPDILLAKNAIAFGKIQRTSAEHGTNRRAKSVRFVLGAFWQTDPLVPNEVAHMKDQ
jgi:hypothetical protein